MMQNLHYYYSIYFYRGLIEMEANVKMKLIVILLAENWGTPYSWTCVYVKSRVIIKIVRTTHWYIWVSWIPTNRVI